MSKLIITGGAGHIGSYILHYKDIPFDEIVVIDNLSTQRYYSLFNLPVNIKFIQDDIDTTNRLEEYFDNADTIIHLAAIVNAGDTIDKEGQTKLTNCTSVEKIVKAAEKCNVNTIVHMSTTSVYGPHDFIRNEDTKDLFPQSPYAIYKLESEKFVLSSSIKNRYVLRAGTAFGYSPGIRFHTVSNMFIWNAITKQPITIWKPGTGKRPYASLGHITSSIMECTTAKHNSGIYNIVTHHWNPLEIVKLIKQYIQDLDVVFVTPKILNQDSYIIDTTKATKAKMYHTSEWVAEQQITQYFQIMAENILKSIK